MNLQMFELSVPQAMDCLIRDLMRQMNELSVKISDIMNSLEPTKKEMGRAEELLIDQLEVGPAET